ncbi:hypothetical protein BKP35_04915 [Anaerobacillus arseniciselenatis]|uniref:PAS domain S-box protein n=1 Tax=Anaerobacillus arseniciselenatis TaxID=85682 RepID=A0A1S2LST5_9BACI|nr:EAL domain-containing protein [Anaerobacillus arseniciselenatis]OIJ15193.1 hypothetical protein BKP35_04915 [Anaerobacillus arseniciselenatis]
MKKLNTMELLQYSKMALSDISDEFQVGIWSVCLQTNSIIEFSDALEKIYEEPKRIFEEDIHIWRDFIHDKDYEEVIKSQKDLKKGKMVKNKYRIKVRSGKVKCVYVSLLPHLNKDSDLIRIDGIIVDITNSEKAIIKTEKKLADIKYAIDQTNNIMITDKYGVMTYVNDFVCQSSKYSREELLGKTPKMLKSGVHSKEFYKNLWDTINSGNIWKGEICNRTKDGSLYWTKGTIVPFIDDDGKPYQFVSIRNDVTEQKKLEHEILLNRQQIEYIAYHDYLTDLTNRRYFEENVEKKIAKSEAKSKMAVIVLDLDRFKYVNDTLGHCTGDQLLKQIGDRLRNILTEGVSVSRIGGDEFGIIVNNEVILSDLPSFLKQLLRMFEEPFLVDDLELFFTTSMGVSIYPTCGNDVKTLLKNANIALYRVKDEGRNNYQFFDPTLDVDNYKKFSIANDLRKAIKNDEFSIHYQPKVNIQNNQIIGAEALIRWNHPVWGNVPPIEFITIAEETWFINELGHWVFESVCQQLKLWEKERVPQIPIAINFSPIQFLQQNLVENLITVINKYDIDPQLIEVEVTETALLNNEQQVHSIIEEMRELGIKVALDDFGTGYSSLVYLKKFKIDALKVDQYFLKNITIEKNSQQILDAVVKLAHSLNMTVVVEGVETNEQLELIYQYKDLIVQGYLFSKPIPAIELVDLLRNGQCFPKEVKGSESIREKRRFFRVPFKTPIEGEMTVLQIGSKPLQLGFTKILIENIGAGGLCYSSHINLPVRKYLLLKVKFKVLGTDLALKAKISWSQSIEGFYQYGIEFIMTEREKADLIYLLNQLQISLKRNPTPPESNTISISKNAYLKRLLKGN